jgi:uncharacterized protein YbaR (Trm112 family)
VVSQELLEILRCPNCVRNGPDAGLLDHEGNWLICHDCDRKYPIRDDIPVMLIEEGERFQDVPREELPEVPPPEERPALSVPPIPSLPGEDRQKLFLILLGLALGIGVAVLVVYRLRQAESDKG